MAKKVKALFLIYMILMVVLLSSYENVQTALNNQINWGKLVIVVDAGHGGIDSGCSNDGLLEKDINLQISNYTAQMLRACGIAVICTRTTDIEIVPKTPDITYRQRWQQDLMKRVKIAEEAGAKALLSIHINSISSSRWHGPQVFYDPERESSEILASYLQQQLNIITEGNRLTNTGDYYVTREAEIPSVIIEAGFLSNASESQKLISESYQRKIAWAITRGMLQWLVDNN